MEWIQTQNYYKNLMLSEMNNSDLACIISDKYEEKKNLEIEKMFALKWWRWDNRKMLELVFNDEIISIEKIIRHLSYELKNRDIYNKDNKSFEEKIIEAKNSIWIIDVVEYLSSISVSLRWNTKCCLHWHDDSTASLHVYENTNSFYCFGCHRWWDQIDFIQHYYDISKLEAMKKFINFLK